jgi:L-cystine uptake protein TcyP (sodium:dicarboxylate symporter family)
MAAQERNLSGRLRYCFFLTVVDSVVVFSAGESGLKGSIGFTSVLWLPQIRIAMMI